MPEAVLPSMALLFGAIIVFLGAVWFGRRLAAGRIQSAVDRIDADDEEPGDRRD